MNFLKRSIMLIIIIIIIIHALLETDDNINHDIKCR